MGFNIKFTNNAATTLASGINNTDVTLSVSPGTGALFPAITGGQYFYCTLFDTLNNIEIIKVTARSTDAFTIVRAQEGTTARTWNAGTKVELRLTKQGIYDIMTYVESVESTLTALSDTVTQIQNQLYPTGCIIASMIDVVPTGFLECNGSAVSRETYADLFDLIGTRYGVGDSLTTFNLPDLRGEFLRGWAHGSSNDPDRASRTSAGDGVTVGDNVGTKQAFNIQSHNHGLDVGGQMIAEGGAWAYGDREHGEPINTSVCQTTGGNETRPRNVSVMYCIKF